VTTISRLCTSRLDLIAATVAHLDAELDSPAQLGALLRVEVPDGWPPGEYDRPAIEFFRARMLENPAAAGRYGWYAVLRSSSEQRATLVGAGGYFGPPDGDGIVEVGYSVLAAFEGRGYATEIVRALVAHAFSHPGVVRVIARTRPENIGSVKVLERCGFTLAGPGDGPGSVEYRLAKPSP